MEVLGVVLDFEDHMARFKALKLGPLRLPQLPAGHLGLPLFRKQDGPRQETMAPLSRWGVVELPARIAAAHKNGAAVTALGVRVVYCV